jgi:hypothetical protein
MTVRRKSPMMAGRPTFWVGAATGTPTVRALVPVDGRLPASGLRPVAVILMGETMGEETSSISWAVRTRLRQSV